MISTMFNKKFKILEASGHIIFCDPVDAEIYTRSSAHDNNPWQFVNVDNWDKNNKHSIMPGRLFLRKCMSRNHPESDKDTPEGIIFACFKTSTQEIARQYDTYVNCWLVGLIWF